MDHLVIDMSTCWQPRNGHARRNLGSFENTDPITGMSLLFLANIIFKNYLESLAGMWLVNPPSLLIGNWIVVCAELV